MTVPCPSHKKLCRKTLKCDGNTDTNADIMVTTKAVGSQSVSQSVSSQYFFR